jgi:hypothetical protein
VIELSRKQIHLIRSTIRQTLGITSNRHAPFVTFQVTSGALLIRAANERFAVECRVPGEHQPACFTVPYECLTACEGRQGDIVQFEQSEGLVRLRWFEAGIPQSVEYSTAEPVSMPEVPKDLAAIDPQFIRAMADACDTAATDSTRYAIHCVQLRGTDGQIAATDGQQALIQTGFQFPWNNEVLVPATAGFACKALGNATDVSLGRSAEWMFVRAGDWTIALKMEKDLRFPAVETYVPDVSAAVTTFAVSDEDAEFLARAAKKLPGSSEPNAPVTLDLNGAAVVRAKSADQESPTDLVLTNSRRIGAEMKVSTDRQFVERAMQLGFRAIYLRDAEAPAFCRDARRSFIWALLSKNNVLSSDINAVRIESPVAAQATPATPSKSSPPQRTPSFHAQPPRNRISMATSEFDQTISTPSENTRTDARGLTTLIEDAESLRVSLRDVLAKTNTLVVGLKRQRQQSKLMRTALKSLRAVQEIES